MLKNNPLLVESIQICKMQWSFAQAHSRRHSTEYKGYETLKCIF